MPQIGFVVARLDGTILEANDVFARMLGYTVAELRSGSLFDLTSPEFGEVERRMIDELRQHGFTSSFVKEALAKGGEPVRLILSASLVEDDSQEMGQRCLIHAVDGRSIVPREPAPAQRERIDDADWSQLLSAITSAVITFDFRATIRAVAEALVREKLCDWTTIAIGDRDGVLRYAASYHADAAQRLALEAVHGRICDADLAAAEPRLAANAHCLVREADLVRLFEGMGTGSAAVVPLNFAGSLTGAITFVRSPLRPAFTPEDLRLLRALADCVASVAHVARMGERDRTIAITFQNAALPERLPVTVGHCFDAVYRAGGEEARVGGDWYDAFELVDGRIVIMIGDVSGSGIAAAATMSEARQTIRGAAGVNPDPLVMLTSADRMLRQHREAAFATAWVAVIDPVELQMTYAGAGHLAPILREPDGTIVRLEAPGLPLGLRDMDDGPRRYERLLAPGSYLVLYTDGLTESGRAFLADEDRLERIVAELPFVPAAATIVEGLLAGRPVADDIAVMTVGFRQRFCDAGTPSIFRWTSETLSASEVARMRRAVVDALHAAKMGRRDVLDAELVFSELIANVVRHASGPTSVLLDLNRRKPVLHVLDRGPSFRFETSLPVEALSEAGRGLYLISQFAAEFSISERIGGGTHARAVLANRLFHRTLAPGGAGDAR